MFKLFSGQQPAPKPKRQVIGTYNGFTLADWNRSDAHIKWAKDMMSEPKFRDMLAVISNARPSATLSHITETEAAIALGRRIGYDEIFGILLSLASFPRPEQPPVEADYGANEFDLTKTV